MMRTLIIKCFLLLVCPVVGQTGWVQVPTPDPSEELNFLRGISGTDTSNIWAVGNYQSSPAGTNPMVMSNLVLQWEGGGWIEHEVQNFGSTQNMLTGVHTFGEDDVWAVGYYGGLAMPQIHHWNGSSWTSTAVSLPGGGGAFLDAIDATSPEDIWAVGGWSTPGTGVALAYHYDGSTWSVEDVPPVGNATNWLHDVSALTPDDAWAVGHQRTSPSVVDRFMIVHWNGVSWTPVPIPAELESVTGRLNSVKMIATDDVWASATFSTIGPVVIHWDGSEWSVVQSGGQSRRAFAPLTPDHMYAFGSAISHWNGVTWSVVDPLEVHYGPSLTASTVLGDGGIWAAGNVAEPGGEIHTLVYRLDDLSTAIGKADADRVLKAFPLPFHDILHIDLGMEHLNVQEVKLIELSGALVRSLGWELQERGILRVDASDPAIPEGAFLLRIITREEVYQVRVIKS